MKVRQNADAIIAIQCCIKETGFTMGPVFCVLPPQPPTSWHPKNHKTKQSTFVKPVRNSTRRLEADTHRCYREQLSTERFRFFLQSTCMTISPLLRHKVSEIQCNGKRNFEPREVLNPLESKEHSHLLLRYCWVVRGTEKNSEQAEGFGKAPAI